MRSITKQACKAFVEGKEFSQANMLVTHENEPEEISRMYLHGNLIIELSDTDGDGIKTLRATLAGWPTVTTRDRINGLCEYLNLNTRVFQEKHAQYVSRLGGFFEITAHEWFAL